MTTDRHRLIGLLGSVLRRCEVDDDTGCWLWTGCTTAQGYPVAKVRGRRLVLHRLMVEARHGDITPNVVHHSCEVRRCVAPAHLHVLSNAEHARLHGELRRQGRELGAA